MAASRRGAGRLLVPAIVIVGMIAAATPGPGRADPGTGRSPTATGRIAERALTSAADANEKGTPDSAEALEGAEQYARIRTLPAETVPAAAYRSARRQAAALASTGGTWTEITRQPYQSDAAGYEDPVFSNSGGGAGFVSGRIQGLAVDGSTVFAAAADGGVWRSRDRGRTWTAVGDHLPTLSGGSVAVNPADHSVWFGSGEASTAFENYAGLGVYRSRNDGQTWRRVGGHELEGQMIGTLVFGRGFVFAATTGGVYRHRSRGDLSTHWQRVLAPGTAGPYGFRFANDVAVRPRTNGRVVIAALGWRTGSVDYAGFWRSTKGGARGTWHRVRTRGKLRSSQIGRASFAYSADGTRLYALVESWQYALSEPSALYGIFRSTSGDLRGPWERRAGWQKLAGSGSAMAPFGNSYAPGVQAWYNQAIGVDPADRNHLYVGLEEVYESTNGGGTWTTAGPYWNFTLPCSPSCLNTTHPDQHAVAFGPGVVYVGNDGGVYRRPRSRHTRGGWVNLNRTLHTLQYYHAAVGQTARGDTYWGGLQDNGVGLLRPGASQQVSPFGGDGGDVIVHPSKPKNAVVEYTDMDMALTTNGGASNGHTLAFREISPSCSAFTYTPSPCDPNPRFIAPFEADPESPDQHWVAGGQDVWETTEGWNTTCSESGCDWTIGHDLGSGNSTTALAVQGATVYAGWCGGADRCNPGDFESGIDTNAGGSWQRVVDGSGNGGDPLPQRYITGLALEPGDPQHVFVAYGGYSRRWIDGGGVGHVFESTDGGATWTGITGNLPDVPAADVEVVGDHLVLATDLGVFTSALTSDDTWSRLGGGLPNAALNSLAIAPDGSFLVAVTHGRGLWKIAAP
ncbi:MAG TPA: glycosyl hydrolase [Actinomycetota bacterium]|nr:glycosyl hydrolase [Actinomycetota bacterium]